MALLLLLIVGVGARECLEERGCLDTGIGREEKAGECLEEEGGGCLDTGGNGRECWEGVEAGLALRAWVLSEGGGERQEVNIIICHAKKCAFSNKFKIEIPCHEKVQYYETVISLLMTEEGPWYLLAGGWQGAFYYEAAARVEGSRYCYIGYLGGYLRFLGGHLRFLGGYCRYLGGYLRILEVLGWVLEAVAAVERSRS